MATQNPVVSPLSDQVLLDFDVSFLKAIRTPGELNWPERFGYVPTQTFRNLTVRFPIDLTVFGMTAFEGKWTFRNKVYVHTDLKITKWTDGIELDVNLLRDEQSDEMILWEQQTAKLIDSYRRFLVPQVYDTLFTADSTGAV